MKFGVHHPPLLGSRTSRSVFITVVLVFLFAVSGCQSRGYVPVEEFAQPPSERISTHWVAQGETLYSIAWRYNFDTQALAKLNGIRAPYRLVPGQKLALDRATARAMGLKSQRYQRIASSSPVKKRVLSKSKRLSEWVWPTQGKVLEGQSRARHRKGVRIGGSKGQSVVAANHGTVVYAGNGLPAMGNLLIVKHSGDYLSAYAHNDRLLVADGQTVSAGQKIAELGSSGTSTRVDQLHFEIRYKGQAVNPLALLPQAG